MKEKLRRVPTGLLVFILVFAWVFSGWPQILGFPPKIQEAKAAITSVGSLGSTNSEVANQTSIVLTTDATAEVDNMIVVVVAKDNITIVDSTTAGDVTSVIDTRDNSYTKAHEFVNSQGGEAKGAHVSVWFARVTTQLTSGDTITANFVASNANDKTAIRAWEFTVAAGSTFQVEDTTELATDGADPGSMTSGTVGSQEWLFFRGIAYESDADVAGLTPTTNFTDIGVESTDGGGEAGNMGVTGEFRIVTATSETSDPTAVGDTTFDNANVFIVFEEITPSVTLTQDDFRWYNDETTVTLTDLWGTVITGDNEDITALPFAMDPPVSGDKLRLQINLTVTGVNMGAGTQDFILEYKEGTDQDCSTGSWTAMGPISASGTDWRFFDNTSLTDKIDEVNQISTSDVVGDYVESDPTDTNPNAINIDQSGEWDFAIETGTTFKEATSYAFRLIQGGTGVTVAYTAGDCPTLETAPVTAGLMRHGNFFVSGAEKGFFWAN